MKIIVPLILMLVISAHAQSPPQWQSAFCKTLKAVAQADHSKRLSPGDVYGSLGVASAKLPDLTNAGNAVVNLFLSGETENVELVWWRQSDRPTRVLAVALFSCIAADPVSGIPPFEAYADRFTDKDAAQRREEIAFVKEHLSAIAAEFSKLTTGIPRAQLSHDGYTSVAKAKIGSPLPTSRRRHENE
jgi:hypothetical protein